MWNYGNRDQAMGLYYEQLRNAGAVEEEIVLYGCLCLDNKNELSFFVTGKEEKFFQFLLNSEQNDAYCTPGTVQSIWAKIAKGEKYITKRKYQFEMIRNLKNCYSNLFFNAITKLKGITPTDEALPILTELRTRFDNRFYDIDIIHLYIETVSMAVQMKVLTSYRGHQLINSVKKIEKQLLEDELLQDAEQHTFAGLAYLDDNTDIIHYLQFGKQYNAWEKRQKLLSQGKLVSPVFVKKQYYNATDYRIVQQKKQIFENCMREKMGEEYFGYLKQLYALPAIMDNEDYFRVLRDVQLCCNEKENAAFKIYSGQLRMQKLR